MLLAFANGWAEEIIVVALPAHPAATAAHQPGGRPGSSPALLRGAYHLYQGYSAGLGNVVMGLVFGYVWLRTGRLWPLIVAHGLIDAVAFVGYSLAAGELDWLS